MNRRGFICMLGFGLPGAALAVKAAALPARIAQDDTLAGFEKGQQFANYDRDGRLTEFVTVITDVDVENRIITIDTFPRHTAGGDVAHHCADTPQETDLLNFLSNFSKQKGHTP